MIRFPCPVLGVPGAELVRMETVAAEIGRVAHVALALMSQSQPEGPVLAAHPLVPTADIQKSAAPDHHGTVHKSVAADQDFEESLRIETVIVGRHLGRPDGTQ